MGDQPPSDGNPDDPKDTGDSGVERPEGQSQTAWTQSEVKQLFSSPDRVRFLYVIAGHPDRQLTADEICDIGGLDPTTFARHKEVLLENGIIEHGEAVGDLLTYRLNRSHPIAQGFGLSRQDN